MNTLAGCTSTSDEPESRHYDNPLIHAEAVDLTDESGPFEPDASFVSFTTQQDLWIPTSDGWEETEPEDVYWGPDVAFVNSGLEEPHNGFECYEDYLPEFGYPEFTDYEAAARSVEARRDGIRLDNVLIESDVDPAVLHHYAIDGHAVLAVEEQHYYMDDPGKPRQNGSWWLGFVAFERGDLDVVVCSFDGSSMAGVEEIRDHILGARFTS